MIEAGASPEQILSLLGITEPDDLDIEAIAYACGATILPQPLSGCEPTHTLPPQRGGNFFSDFIIFPPSPWGQRAG